MVENFPYYHFLTRHVPFLSNKTATHGMLWIEPISRESFIVINAWR